MCVNNHFDCILSKSDNQLLLQLIYESLSCTKFNHLKVLFEKLKNITPFESAVALLADFDPIGNLISDSVINVNYPDEWIKIYKNRKFYTIDPILIELFSSLEFQYWPNAYKKHRAAREFISLASDFGLNEGYSYGLKDIKSPHNTIFSFAGESVEENKRTEYILLNVIPHFHNAVIRILTNELVKSCKVSLREKEVLKWVRQGKSSWDISQILGISERTVNFHSSNAMLKLNAVTRAQAVGNAMSLGLIDID